MTGSTQVLVTQTEQHCIDPLLIMDECTYKRPREYVILQDICVPDTAAFVCAGLCVCAYKMYGHSGSPIETQSI